MIKQYVVDAFSDRIFAGNPAAICVLDRWLSDDVMLFMAMENNLSETAFAVKEGEHYRLRWFTPGGEIDLCGHATLACAYVILNRIETAKQQVLFHTLSGDLTVSKSGDLYEMDFPAYRLKRVDVTEKMAEAMGAAPKEAYLGRDLLCVFDHEYTVLQLKPDLALVKELEGLLLHVTAPGRDTDCVSRSFAPKLNVPEDPVCGSGHCHIIPYWADRLGQKDIVAYQASQRGGTLYCKMEGDRVMLAGKAALYSVADVYIEA